MPDSLTASRLHDALRRVAAKLEACADELNALDAALGDGDLGVTMIRGARTMLAEIPSLPDDIGISLMKCAQAFTRVSGSTYGTLLATGMMSAAKATKGRSEIPWAEVPSLLAGALAAMSQRGKGQLGEKTVLDALEAARAATEGLDQPSALLNAADHAIAASIEQFRDQPCRQGRARIFGDKSAGRDDPGMVAFKRMVEALK